MALTRKEMDRAIDEHFGYEAADDVEGVLATLTQDVKHDIVGWPGGPTYGRENARTFYQALFADVSDSKVTSTKRLYGDNFLVDESLWEGKAVGRPYGLEGKGRSVRFRVLHVIEFSDDNQIMRENVWVDLAELSRQLPTEA